jgi:diguanylate cyclase (GGDEF)-like protein
MASYFPHSAVNDSFLSVMPAGHRQRRLALIVVLAASALCLVGWPFASTALPAISAFIPIYESWLVLLDLITAVLLFGQFAILRLRALLVIGSGYLFTSAITSVHMLSFPGLLTPTGLFGGTDTPSWIYACWKLGFFGFLLVYAFLNNQKVKPIGPLGRARFSILVVSAIVLLTVGAMTLLANVGQRFLPTIMIGTQFSPEARLITAGGLMFAVVVLVLLWRRTYSVLDIWLLVAGCIQVLEVALGALFNSGRFDLGWYLSRTYGLAAMSFVLVMVLLENNRLYARLADSRAELRRLAVIDPLTRVANRRAFDHAIDQEWRRAGRGNTAIALLLIDVDRFKSFNDEHGHVTGDHCLCMVADTLAANVRRAGEMVARYGGEEFAILLPGSNLTKASELARQLLGTIRRLDVAIGGNKPHITISVGVASMSPHEPDPVDLGPSALIEAADRALYAAKAGGRNQVAEYLPHIEGGHGAGAHVVPELPFAQELSSTAAPPTSTQRQ